MNILTFDIEDWFNLLEHPLTDDIQNWKSFESRVFESTIKILDLLDEHNTKATFFILGWVAENHPKVVIEINKRGHDIGSHSYAHKVAYSQSKKEFKDDLEKSIFLLEDIIGRKILAYRAPGFSITPKNMWAYELLFENGIKYDSSIFPAARFHGGFKDFPTSKPFKFAFGGQNIFSFPLNVKNLFGVDFVYSGGGYFRLLPQFVIEKFIRSDDYVMTYFHPRDFDYKQPMLGKLNLFRKFKSYYGLRYSFTKLSQIISNNSFISLDEAVKEIDWDKQQSINLKDYLV